MSHERAPTGRWYSRRVQFTERQREAIARDGEICPITGLATAVIVAGKKSYFRAVDHLWPEKWVRSFCKGADPHVLSNLMCIHNSLHARKTRAERYLYAGNLLSFKQEMIRLGYEWSRFETALTALNASVKKLAKS